MAGGKIDILVEPDVKGFGPKLESGLGPALGVATKIGAALGVAIGGVEMVKAIGQIGIEFDSQMNSMAAVSQATAAQLEAVQRKARELGTDAELTATSAADAAAAMTELAKGGFSVEESMSAAKGTLQLAAAAQTDAASAATVQAQAIQAFGLAAEDAARVSDILAGAANASSAEIGDVSAALQQSGTVANQFGVSLEDTATAIAMFANAGITGSDAGTLLKTAMLALTDQGKPAQAAIEQLGLTVYDSQGKFVGMSSLMGQLNDAAGRMTEEQYQAATATLFGSDAMRLAGIAAKQGSEDFEKLRDAVTRQGQAAEVAAAQTQGLPGVIERLQNVSEDLKLGIYDAVKDEVVDGANLAVTVIEDASPRIIAGFEAAARGARGFIDMLKPVGDEMKTAIGSPTARAAAEGMRTAIIGVWEAAKELQPSVVSLASAFAKASAAIGVTGWDLLIAALKTTSATLEIIAGPLETVTGFLERHPALVATAMGAWLGFKTVPGVVGGITKSLEPATSAIGLFGGAVRDSWKFAAQAHPEMSALGRSMVILNANGVSATGALNGLKAAGTGIMNVFGGPWGLALSGAALAIASVVDYSNAGASAEAAIAASADQAAAAHDRLRTAASQTVGALNEEGLAAAVDLANAKLAEFNELGQVAVKWQANFDSSRPFIEADADRYQAENPNMSRSDAEAQAAKLLKESYSELQSAMDELGMTQSDVSAAIASGGPVYEQLVESLRSSGDYGSYAADHLQGVRDEIQQQVTDARSLDPAYRSVADAVDILADASSSAEEKMSALDTLMQEMGLRPKDTENAMREAADSIREVAQEAENLQVPADQMGAALFDASGKLDYFGNESAGKLADQMDKLYDSLIKTASSGGDVDEAFANMQGTLGIIQQEFGLTDAEMQKVQEQFGLMPEEIKMAVELEGADETEKDIYEVMTALQGVEDGKEIEVEALTDDAIKALEAAGISVEEIPGSKNVMVSVDDMDAQTALDALGIKTRELPTGEIEILDNTPETMAKLEKLGLEVSKDKEGRVVIKDNAQVTANNVKTILSSIKDKTVTVWVDHVKRFFGGDDSSRRNATGGRIPQLATGGRTDTHGGYRLPTTGPGTDRTDGFLGYDTSGTPTAWVNAGEWVTNAHRSAIFDSTLAAINTGTPNQIVAALMAELPRLASGGKVTAGQLLDFFNGKQVLGQQASRSLHGAIYDWGGYDWGDCSATMGQGALFAAGRPATNGRYMTTYDEDQKLSALGFIPGTGTGARFLVGWLNGGPGGGHTSGTIYDDNGNATNVEMGGGGAGNGKIGPTAAPGTHPQYTDRAHLPLAAAPTAGNANDATTTVEVDSTSTSGMTVGGRHVNWGEAQTLYESALDFIKRTRVYDAGGILPVGGFAANLGKKPERILPPSETAAYELAIKTFPGAAEKLAEAAGKFDEGTDTFLREAAKAQDQAVSYGSTLGGDWLGQTQIVRDAEQGLLDTRRAIADENKAVAERERELADARAELAKAESEGGGLTLAQKRKMEDAQRKLAEAKSAKETKDKAKKIADAERNLARVREDNAIALEKSADKNAKAVLAAQKKVEKAEDELAEARGATADQSDRLLAAERTIAAARWQAAADFAVAISQQAAAQANVLAGFWDEMARAADIVDKVRQSVSALQMDKVNADLALIKSSQELQVKEQDVFRARARGVMSIAEAEWNLTQTRDQQTRLGLTSVEAMGGAMDRFRETGQFAIGEISEDVINQSAAVKEAEWKVFTARQQAALDEHNAMTGQALAAFDLAMATMDQQAAVEMLRLQTAQLADQARELHGLTANQARGASKGWGGIGNALGGLGTLAAGVATGIAGFAAGGLLGAIPGVIMAVKGLGQAVKGGVDAVQNRQEIADSWKGMGSGSKAGLALGILGGTAINIAGGVASQKLGPEAMVGASQISTEFMDATIGGVQHGIAGRIEKTERDYADRRAALQREHEARRNQISGERLIYETSAASKRDALEAGVEFGKLQELLMQANTKQEAKAIAEAAELEAERMGHMLDTADKQHTEMQKIREQMEKLVELTSSQSAALGTGLQNIKVELPPGESFTRPQVESLLDQTIEGLAHRISQLERADQPTATTYFAARS